MSDRRDLVFIGDAHLDSGEPAVEDFARFLTRLAPATRCVVLMGDLFNLWIGQKALEQPHQSRVLDAMRALRRAGVTVRYVEGNRDYRITAAYAGDAVDDATDGGLVERQGGRSLFAIHGDLANRADRQYRAWRRLSRSLPVWLLFTALPRSVRLGVAQDLETRMRRTNLGYKRAFPEAAVRDYAASTFAMGHDALVLGHFHAEIALTSAPPASPGRIFVLPEWQSTRRHLRVDSSGGISFTDSDFSR